MRIPVTPATSAVPMMVPRFPPRLDGLYREPQPVLLHSKSNTLITTLVCRREGSRLVIFFLLNTQAVDGQYLMRALQEVSSVGTFSFRNWCG